MENLLKQLRLAYPDLHFRAGNTFVWSPETHEIIYRQGAPHLSDTWALLHETGHALLAHSAYSTDFELIRLEVSAWERAKQLGQDFGIDIDEDHIQDCLDTYRDWIYARSICPRCSTKSLQQADLQHYRCFNCHETWRVSRQRFCRAYRATKRAEAGSPEKFDALASI